MSIDKKSYHKEVIILSDELITFFMSRKPVPALRLALFALTATVARLAAANDYELDLLIKYAKLLTEDMEKIKAKKLN